ncbi:uncharacterized protein LOC119388943 [Rhipicephalus sanguineus]|uniref:uncharacterized protein LOC119388943 n=1 Tax=Rhipicephalus sanguineus TaxID=34632 RepID=UPI001895804E|nr:uncharacterized protein LOC119388943 [Rhipicephalus sanguineus]
MWALTPSVFANIHWDDTPIRYLGVPLYNYRNSGPHWTSALTTIRRKVSTWQGRDLSVFAKAKACNIFLASKLIYILQVLHCSRVHIQAFHRIFACFIWSSSWEAMRRDNLFLPLEKGGLSLVHLFVRQLVMRFFYLKDVCHPFLLAVIQNHLSHHLPFLFVTTRVAEESQLWGFLKEIVDTVQFLKARFTLEYLYNVDIKTLTAALVNTLFPEPVYRQQYLSHSGHDVFCRVRKMCISPAVKTFFFKLYTSTLPVKTWLHEKGIYVPWSVNCRLCNEPETIEHCFIHCRDAFHFWDIVKRTLRKEFPITSHGVRFLPFKKSINNNAPYDLIMLQGLYSLWRSRMIDRHAEPPRSTRFVFREEAANVRSVAETFDPVPAWLGLLDVCVCLPDF